MKRDEAEKLLADFFARFGRAGFVFEKADFVKANIGEAVMGFEYRKDKQTLACHALVYRFRNAPRPEVLREIRIAQESDAGTGEGAIVFDFQNLTLSLVKIYSKKVAPVSFARQMQQLATASLIWGSTILDKLAAKSNR